VDSPCIDSGIDLVSLSKAVATTDGFNSDMEGDPRVLGEAPDMGADEYKEEEKIIQVEIDIKPGSSENRINLNSWSWLPVAVKSTTDFGPRSIDLRTVEFAGARPVWRIRYDIDHDRDKDTIFYFWIPSLKLDENSTEATLSGLTRDGEPFEGTDSVSIVKPKGKAKGWRFGRK
jgi:hypothetical protein